MRDKLKAAAAVAMAVPGMQAITAFMSKHGMDELRVPIGTDDPGSAPQKSRHRVAMDKRAAKKARAIRRERGRR